MKSLQEIIVEKLKISKSTSKYDIEELNIVINNFDDALKTFDNYFNVEHDNIVKYKGKLPIKKGSYSSNNFITCSELTSYKIGEYVLWVGNYDYGLVFSPWVIHEPIIHGKVKDNGVLDMLCDTEVTKHYLYGDNFLKWLNKVNIQHLNNVFNI